MGLMKLFLDAGAKVDMRAGELAGRETALHKAAYAGHTKAVELLVERGATIDAADNRGKTALHDAASEGHLEIVKLLVGKGANIEATDKRGKTALLYAVWYGHRDVVVYLLEEGANVEVKDKREYGVQEELEGIEDDEQKDKMEKLLRSYKKK
ncbi:MAG: ankyrin repeat domain-containing protein [Cytophagales bacterium]|nr:ankyrin repeat domain-containing protein [Cytophagales bacterium]